MTLHRFTCDYETRYVHQYGAGETCDVTLNPSVALDLKPVPDSLHTEGLVAHFKCHGDQKSSSLKMAYFERFERIFRVRNTAYICPIFK